VWPGRYGGNVARKCRGQVGRNAVQRIVRVRAGEVVGWRGIGGDVSGPSEARFAAPETPTDFRQRGIDGTTLGLGRAPAPAQPGLLLLLDLREQEAHYRLGD
jgi:hypothetical protein